MKVKLVRKHALAFFSKELGFAEYIIMSRHMEDINMGRKSIDILEDTFEAFIGSHLSHSRIFCCRGIPD